MNLLKNCLEYDKMSKDWQFCFYVKGLIAPEEGVLFNDRLLFRGVKDGDEETHVYFKATVEATEKEEADKEMRKKWNEAENVLREILRIYVLTTGEHAEMLPGRAASIIGPDNPFGTLESRLIGRLREVLSPEKMRARIERYTDLLNRTMKNFDSWASILSDAKMSYLVNALEYLYHAIGDERLEVKLIDLMVCMESLFGGDQELRLRISLRAAFLLSAGREDKRSEIFRRIYDLYHKRSRIVHGGEKVSLNHGEVSDLEDYARESIMRLIPLDLSKKEIVALFDESVYDEDKKKELADFISGTQTT